MMKMTTPRYAARLNAFKIGAERYWPGKNQITTIDLLTRAATVEGLNAVDFNYPDHFDDCSRTEIRQCIDKQGIHLNGLAMRYYTDPAFKLGGFTNPDPRVRQSAIELTLRGIDELSELGGSLMTLWLGQDGFDYSFQANYQQLWDHTLEALNVICDHNKAVDISLEYKPNEPRSYSLMPDVGSNLLALSELNRANTGITLDFAHVLYADEMPAHAAAMVGRYSRLLGVHLNDGYGKRDDGLMIGSVHPVQTVELLVELNRLNYDSTIYFDTFPDLSGLDPVAEATVNVEMANRLAAVASKLTNHAELRAAIANQDAPASQRIVNNALYGDQLPA
ncbi:MAG: TIM barrel protein [Granulosicoccus sp.]|nr:TIM barrel protein [Granulosicoccus sp.]